MTVVFKFTVSIFVFGSRKESGWTALWPWPYGTGWHPILHIGPQTHLVYTINIFYQWKITVIKMTFRAGCADLVSTITQSSSFCFHTMVLCWDTGSAVNLYCRWTVSIKLWLLFSSYRNFQCLLLSLDHLLLNDATDCGFTALPRCKSCPWEIGY